MKHLLVSLTCLGLLSLSGCANTRIGYNFNPAVAEDLDPKLSTKADVRAALGSPLRSHTVGDVTVDVHKLVTPGTFKCVFVSYRGDEVMHVTNVR
jgi:hypothetical protein